MDTELVASELPVKEGIVGMSRIELEGMDVIEEVDGLDELEVDVDAVLVEEVLLEVEDKLVDGLVFEADDDEEVVVEEEVDLEVDDDDEDADVAFESALFPRDSISQVKARL